MGLREPMSCTCCLIMVYENRMVTCLASADREPTGEPSSWALIDVVIYVMSRFGHFVSDNSQITATNIASRGALALFRYGALRINTASQAFRFEIAES